MTPEEIAAKEAATAAAEAKATADAEAKAKADAALSQDPIKQELERVQKRGQGRSEREKAIFARKKIDERLKQLDDEEGITTPLEDDDMPVTVGTLKRFQRQEATKTALQLADEIADENERELVKHNLQNTIRPSGNPAEDLRNARSIVDSLKNRQIAEELARKSQPKSTHSGSGSPANQDGGVFEPTEDELKYMKPPFNVPKEKILEARKKAQV